MIDKDVYDSFSRIMYKKDKKLCDCTKGELLDVIEVIYNENQLLYKALDKACRKLEMLSYKEGIGQVGMCYKEWKEWCIKNG